MQLPKIKNKNRLTLQLHMLSISTFLISIISLSLLPNTGKKEAKGLCDDYKATCDLYNRTIINDNSSLPNAVSDALYEDLIASVSGISVIMAVLLAFLVSTCKETLQETNEDDEQTNDHYCLQTKTSCLFNSTVFPAIQLLTVIVTLFSILIMRSSSSLRICPDMIETGKRNCSIFFPNANESQLINANAIADGVSDEILSTGFTLFFAMCALQIGLFAAGTLYFNVYKNPDSSSDNQPLMYPEDDSQDEIEIQTIPAV